MRRLVGGEGSRLRESKEIMVTSNVDRARRTFVSYIDRTREFYMAQGYAIIANGGYAIKPYVIDAIYGADGATLYRACKFTAG